MVAADRRGTLIVSTAGHFFGVANDDALDTSKSDAVLEKFLDAASCRTLCAHPTRTATDGIRLKLTNELPAGRNALVFFKLRPSAVTEENFHELVHVATTGGPKGSGSALVEALRQVWAPTLQSSGVNPSCLKRLEEDILGPKASSSIAEEESLWRRKREEAKRSHDKRTAEEAGALLKNIRDEIENAATSREGLLGVEEILEEVSGYIDDLWKLDGPAYNEDRMRSLLDVVGNEVVHLVQALLDEVRSTDSRARDEAVATAATVCEKWVNVCEQHTALFWPHQSLHPWKGPAFCPTRCSKFGDRLRQTAEIRAQHRQLTRLLTPNERSTLGTDALLQSFDDLRVGLGEDGKDVEWERLKHRFEESLSPAEEKVTEKLRKQLAGARNSTLLAAEFNRYVELMKRDRLKRSLRSERESLLAAVGDLVESCQAGPDTESLLDTPRILQEVQSARAAETRLEGLKKLAKELLSDLPGYEEASEKITSALKDAEKKRQYLVESWVNDTKSAIDRKELSLGTDSAVVELTGSSMMRVTYEPRLTSLVKEARALAGQGVELPREVRDLVERAGALAGRARALQQVATFHNTIGDRMVPSQRPLMQATALDLARLVREQSGVVWSNPHAVDSYTNRLRALVRKFAQQNSELAAKHATLRDLVAGLLKGEIVNLVGSQGAWKEALRNMRAIVEGVEEEYGNTEVWKLHWDRQLLKVLGVAYRAALPALTRKLPEIRVELTFRDSHLQWRPPLEEVRAKLYSGLRRFLAIPTNFRGVGDPNDGQFGGLVHRSAYLYGSVYKEAEIALAAIEALRVKWIALAAPAKIDVGERLKGKSPQEWERAFKDAKQWAQEVGKLRGGEAKVWCITVDTATTRTDLESASRRYWDRLSSDLRAEASSRLVAVVDFLSIASKELDRRPRNVEEVGLAYEAHTRIQRESASVAEEIEAVTGFARVLASWTREKLDGLSGAHAAWEGLSERMERHRSVVDRQLEDAKVNLRHRAIALQDERERWEARWAEKPEVVTLDWIATMRERWTSMQELRKELTADCQRLELDLNEVLEEDSELSRRLESQLEAEESNSRFQAEFLREFENQVSEEWSVARRRLPRLHDWLDSWETRIRTQLDEGSEDKEGRKKSEEKISSLETETFVGRKIREVRSDVEWLQLLRGDELAEEHWAELKPLLGIEGVANMRDVTLGHLLKSANAIRDNVERVKEITKRAVAESGIRQALTELEAWEATASLQLHRSKDSSNSPICLVGEYAELLARAGELRLILEGAKGAPGYERFAARAARCETALFELEERIKALSTLQRKWVYLEPVYGSGAAPNDSGRWSRADKEFRYLMGEVARDPSVPSLRRLPLPALLNLKDLLDRCQRSLDEFLEEKRSSYPRLYFLSDEDLLELVSGSGTGLDAHLPKLYQGIGSVEKEEGRLKAVVSPEGEVLSLPVPIDLSEALPQWLSNLEDGMREALSQSLDKCLADATPDPSLYPAQVLLLSERIRFTERCESAIREGSTALRNLVEILETQRARFRGLEDAGDRLTALKARGLLLDTVHHLSVARTLLKAVENKENTSWTWSRQLRSYRTNNGPVVRCAGADFPYRFEYQGAAVGLVRTPLTERCFLALTQAMRLGLGGSPTGPAGTGKTESVKALASILGRLVLVFNCDEGMDAGSMRRILGGLAQAGAWGCFDEFNRLEEETLSAVAMLVRPLQEAVRDGAKQVQLGEQNLRLDPHCCVFITMNPAGSDYGGRHKLPDSLARLFRPIGMAHPDRCDIVRALLECEGFLEAPSLANQLVETLDISEKLLSKQPHYDWGLRALRSVLDAVPQDSSSRTETERLLTAIRASTLPKLTEEDTEKFTGLLRDVFPKVDTSGSQDSTVGKDLKKALEEICESISAGDDLVNRCVQLSDQLRNRTGVAVVGPSGSGKTLIRKTLAEALNKIGQSVKQVLIYPGAIPKSRLLGKVDPRTREWREGLLSAAVSTAGDSSTWIILNGDVEPGWAEALNSALDDNRLLTLPSGVGIRLGSGVRFIFETHKLAGASPATVSRLGVVHLGSTSPSALLLPSKLEGLSPASKNVATGHLNTIIKSVSKLIGDRTSAAGLTEAALIHLRKCDTQNRVTHALLASFCGQLSDGETRDEVARLVYQSTDSWCPDPQRPFAVLYNREIDRLEPFGDASRSIPTDSGPVSLSGPVKRALETILPWLEAGYPSIVRGPQGCGKSSLVSAALASRKDEFGEASSIVRGSSLYGPQDLITRLKRSCIRVESSVNGRNYRPRSGSRLVLILEDLHLASKDLQELIRELIQEGGFHEEDLEFARMPIALLCTGNETTRLHPRLEALLASHYLPYPSSKDIVSIVELHLNDSSKSRGSSFEAWSSRMAQTMAETVTSVATSKETTFSWTPKDLALWADSLKYYPSAKDEAEMTRCLWDAGRHLFYPRLTAKDQTRWVSTILTRNPELKNSKNEVYIWKGGNAGLVALASEEWRTEVETAASRCAREGEPVQASISPHLLKTVSGLSWALGSGQRGVALTGRPGAGRKTAAKLAASVSSLRLIDSGPGRARAAVKAAVQAAGIEGEPSLLLLEEHHAREEGMAILAGAIVSRGELPGLLSPEELDGLVAPLADLARKEDFSGTLDQYLYQRLRSLLRVVVILDAGETKKEWLTRSGLLRHCVLVAEGPGTEWWSLDASLRDLAHRLTKKSEDSEPERESPGVGTLVEAHLRAPRQQQAPARFIALLNTWRELREAWSQEVDKKLSSLEAGIGRLREAGERVAKLEDEASKQRQELEIEKGRANAALEQITATMRGATGQRGEMTNLKADTERESAELARRKADIEGELGKVEPLVEQAAQAVAGIGADALAEVRSLRAPPAPVRDVLEGVLRLMGIRDTSWNSMKTFLAKRGVKDEIRTWDARRSTAASLEAVAKLVKERPESFEEKTAKRASVAAAPLAAWVLANLQYGQILEQVAPLEREQRVLAERLSAAEAQLGRLAAGLSSVESRVAQLQEELAEHSRGAAALQLRTEATEASLATARALLNKLDAEHNDWQAQFENLTQRKTRLDVEAAEVASLLVYQDPTRDDKWKKLAIDLLVTEREKLIWRAQGLPADTGSFVGAACTLRGPLVPLLVDPSGVAVSWLKSNVGSRLEVASPSDSKFLTSLELAVRFGKPLLVEEVVELPGVLLPLLRMRALRLGDRTLPAQQGFKLFLASRRDALVDSLPSEADAVLVRVALGAGSKSLAERFVERVLLRETPELEGQRRQTLEREEQLSGERDQARLDLLAQLGAARGQDLLQESQSGQGGGLLASLEATQAKAKEIALALEESRRSHEVLTRRAREHEKLAKFAAHLFKAVRGLANLSPLYVFSAEAFTDIYLEAESCREGLVTSDKKEQESLVEKKLIALTLHHCSNAAYRRHRLPLALHLALSLNPVPEFERNLLLDGASLRNDENSDYTMPDWIPEERKSAVKALAAVLPQVASRFRTGWADDTNHIYSDQSLTSFQKTLAVQALRPDHLHTALSKLASELLGLKDLSLPSWSLKAVAEDEKEDPVLLLLSPGADPGPELEALASSRIASAEGFTEISLGQGQVAQAEAALESACRTGSWILLSNLQLALNWLPRLEGLLRSALCTTNKNPSTRIWLTTEECSGFYPGLAGICRKLAYEPPEGVKRNVIRSLQLLQQRRPESGSADGNLVLAWIHAVLQERRRFVPQGWIRAYEWSEADLEAARELVLVKALSRGKSSGRLDWDAGRGLLDVAVYGGRLQDDFDMRALRAILRDIWSREVFEARRKLAGVLAVSESSRRDPVRAVEQLADLDSPLDYFGLPANAHRAWERAAAESALLALKGMSLKSASGSERRASKKAETKFQRELKNFVEQKASVLSGVRSESGKNSGHPVERFFADERRLVRRLIRVVQTDAESSRVESSKTPSNWLEEWPAGPREVLPFVSGLIARHQAIASLNFGLPEQVDIASLARPVAFLAALKQHTARETGYPLEQLRLRANWKGEDRNEEWKVSVKLDGLLVSGAHIENGVLKELDASASPVAAVQDCRIAFVASPASSNDEDASSSGLEDSLEIPIYSNSQRKQLITSLPVSCPREERDSWLRRGVILHIRAT